MLNNHYTFLLILCYLPTSDLFMAIFSIESRFHLTVGVGLPDALQRSVTFEPSRTITSLELSESSIPGGTISDACKWHWLLFLSFSLYGEKKTDGKKDCLVKKKNGLFIWILYSEIHLIISIEKKKYNVQYLRIESEKASSTTMNRCSMLDGNHMISVNCKLNFVLRIISHVQQKRKLSKWLCHDFISIEIIL